MTRVCARLAPKESGWSVSPGFRPHTTALLCGADRRRCEFQVDGHVFMEATTSFPAAVVLRARCVAPRLPICRKWQASLREPFEVKFDGFARRFKCLLARSGPRQHIRHRRHGDVRGASVGLRSQHNGVSHQSNSRNSNFGSPVRLMIASSVPFGMSARCIGTVRFSAWSVWRRHQSRRSWRTSFQSAFLSACTTPIALTSGSLWTRELNP